METENTQAAEGLIEAVPQGIKVGRRVGKPAPVPDPFVDLDKRRKRAMFQRRSAAKRNARKVVPLEDAKPQHAAYRAMQGKVRLKFKLTPAEVAALVKMADDLGYADSRVRTLDRPAERDAVRVRRLLVALGCGDLVATRDSYRASAPTEGGYVGVTIQQDCADSLIVIAENLDCVEPSHSNGSNRRTVAQLLRDIAAESIVVTRKEQEQHDAESEDSPGPDQEQQRHAGADRADDRADPEYAARGDQREP